jgi:hypothetical protein
MSFRYEKSKISIDMGSAGIFLDEIRANSHFLILFGKFVDSFGKQELSTYRHMQTSVI